MSSRRQGARALPLHPFGVDQRTGMGAERYAILATHRWRRGLEEGRACGTLHSPPVLTLFALLESDSLRFHGSSLARSEPSALLGRPIVSPPSSSWDRIPELLGE